jgi:hypothetical protein
MSKELTDDRIKQILKATRCKKLYTILYGDITKIIVTQEDIDDGKFVSVTVNSWDDRSFDRNISKEQYLDTFIAVLQRINIPVRGVADRINFNIFLDTCWDALHFDSFSLGTLDVVYNQDTCENINDYSVIHLIRPYLLRKYCLDHIKAFFIKELEVEVDCREIDETRMQAIEVQFKGEGSILYFKSNYNFNCNTGFSYLREY